MALAGGDGRVGWWQVEVEVTGCLFGKQVAEPVPVGCLVLVVEAYRDSVALADHHGSADVVGVDDDRQHVEVVMAEADGDDLGAERRGESAPAPADEPGAVGGGDSGEPVGSLLVFVDADEDDAAEGVGEGARREAVTECGSVDESAAGCRGAGGCSGVADSFPLPRFVSHGYEGLGAHWPVCASQLHRCLNREPTGSLGVL